VVAGTVTPWSTLFLCRRDNFGLPFRQRSHLPTEDNGRSTASTLTTDVNGHCECVMTWSSGDAFGHSVSVHLGLD